MFRLHDLNLGFSFLFETLSSPLKSNKVPKPSGQAIQNMNIACGLEEDVGLTSSGLGII